MYITFFCSLPTLRWVSSLICSVPLYHGTLDIMSGYPVIIACLDLCVNPGLCAQGSKLGLSSLGPGQCGFSQNSVSPWLPNTLVPRFGSHMSQSDLGEQNSRIPCILLKYYVCFLSPHPTLFIKIGMCTCCYIRQYVWVFTSVLDKRVRCVRCKCIHERKYPSPNTTRDYDMFPLDCTSFFFPLLLFLFPR